MSECLLDEPPLQGVVSSAGLPGRLHLHRQHGAADRDQRCPGVHGEPPALIRPSFTNQILDYYPSLLH